MKKSVSLRAITRFCMTEKKEQILQAALRLFAQQGYDATPTSQIAREAGVSEGGMFRHFPNKEALMQAVLDIGHEKVNAHVDSILSQQDPRGLLSSLIELPQLLIQHEPEFWSVQMSLKWQGKFKGKWQEPPYNAALMAAAIQAFAQLGYTDPQAEALLLFTTLEGWSNVLVAQLPRLQDPNGAGPAQANLQSIAQLLLAKYGLTSIAAESGLSTPE